MIETITQHDLVRLVYQETDRTQTEILKNEILCDEGFAESFYQFQEVKEQLNKMVLHSKSNSWTDKVSAYAQSKIS